MKKNIAFLQCGIPGVIGQFALLAAVQDPGVDLGNAIQEITPNVEDEQFKIPLAMSKIAHVCTTAHRF